MRGIRIVDDCGRRVTFRHRVSVAVGRRVEGGGKVGRGSLRLLHGCGSGSRIDRLSARGAGGWEGGWWRGLWLATAAGSALEAAWERGLLSVAAGQTVLLAGINVKVRVEDRLLGPRFRSVHFLGRQLTGAVAPDVDSVRQTWERVCGRILWTIRQSGGRS